MAGHDEVQVESDQQAHQFGHCALVHLGERIIEQDQPQRPVVVAQARQVAVGGGEQRHVGDEPGFALGQLGPPGQSALLTFLRAEDGHVHLVPLPVVQRGGQVGGVAAARVGGVELLDPVPDPRR
jgi:hypothetical protein